jgi:hypothetical protein
MNAPTELRIDAFIIRAEPRDWVVSQLTGENRRTREGEDTGEPGERQLGYYGSLRAALVALVDHGLKAEGTIDAELMVARIDALRDEIAKAFPASGSGWAAAS